MYKARNGKTGKLMALKRIRMKTEKDGVNVTVYRSEKMSIKQVYTCLVPYHSDERNQIITKIKT